MKNLDSARSAIKKNYASVINRIRPLAGEPTTVGYSVRRVRASSNKLQAASFKRQATSIKRQAFEPTSSFKRQATSIPARVTSVKHQATSSKLLDS